MKYICDLCGFIYDEAKEGPMPDDFVCPVCGVSKDQFVEEQN